MSRPAPRVGASRAMLACCLTLCALTSPAGASSALSGQERLVAGMLAETPVASDLEFLCDRIGGRPTGSPACERSIDWFTTRFREAGTDRVWTEEFTLPSHWQEGRSSAVILSPERIPLRLIAMPFSPGTPKNGLTAPVVALGDGTLERFREAGDRVRGALLLVDSKILLTWDDLFEDYDRLPGIMQRAQASGAAGLLVVGGRARDLLYRHVATMGDPAPLPMAILAREDGLRLARMARLGGTRVRLDLDARTGPAFPSRNVLAEIKGRERPQEIVVAGAHLDSWELGTGALDNGANCAMLLDIARQMAATGTRPRRTVRFILFTGEEQGLFGSLGYVKRHRDELDRHVAAIIFDAGTGRITGFSQGGRDDLRPFLAPALASVVGYDVTNHTSDASISTDNFDFLLEGVPNLVANQEPANYMENYHASSDTYDKADQRELKINGAIAAAIVWGMAEEEGRAKRQSRTEIAKLLESSGLSSQMRTAGIWDSWEKKARGRAD